MRTDLVSIRAALTYPARPSKLIRPKKKPFLSSVKRARFRSFAAATREENAITFSKVICVLRTRSGDLW